MVNINYDFNKYNCPKITPTATILCNIIYKYISEYNVNSNACFFFK